MPNPNQRNENTPGSPQPRQGSDPKPPHPQQPANPNQPGNPDHEGEQTPRV